MSASEDWFTRPEGVSEGALPFVGWVEPSSKGNSHRVVSPEGKAIIFITDPGVVGLPVPPAERIGPFGLDEETTRWWASLFSTDGKASVNQPIIDICHSTVTEWDSGNE